METSPEYHKTVTWLENHGYRIYDGNFKRISHAFKHTPGKGWEVRKVDKINGAIGQLASCSLPEKEVLDFFDLQEKYGNKTGRILDSL